MKTFNEIISEVKNIIKEISPEEVNSKLNNNELIHIVDIREKEEVKQGYIDNSKNIPRGFLELNIEKLIPNRNSEIIIYCAGGIRSILGAKTLMDMGYKNVLSMKGGFVEWKNSGFKYIKDDLIEFTPKQLEQYSRQILLPEIGENGQSKLLKSKILLIGAGGLGSSASLYLTAAGIGNLGIIDSDNVDLSNLHRQILHSYEKIGLPKVNSAKDFLQKINTDTKIITYNETLNSKNAIEIIKDYDIVIDGSDNFPTKYLINDTCYFTGKPNIYGSIYKFEGQLTVFDSQKGSGCYRCLFPSPPPKDSIPNCQESGVLGALPGIIGILQAIEAIKIIISKGEVLKNKLLIYDSLNTSFMKINLKKDPNCKLCGKDKSIDKLIDYDNFCS